MREPEGEVDFKPPAVWFPYDRMGRSASDILFDECGGDFGPFGGQLFVGDQFGALIMRVDLELIGGQWQGACFPFLKGLDSGVNRLAWGPDGSLFVGMTNRGWFSFGNRAWGLQRVVYTGEVPFEILHMRAMSDGFEIEFTKPLAPEGALDESAFAMSCFTHERWERYGSPEIDRRTLTVTSARVSEDGRTVRLVVPNLRERFVHELSIGSAVRSFDGDELLHAQAWYTLNHLPGDPP